VTLRDMSKYVIRRHWPWSGRQEDKDNRTGDCVKEESKREEEEEW